MTKDGGPAFPSTTQYFPHDTNCDEQLGMSLRDYLAAKAMQSLVADPESAGMGKAAMATWAYAMADAMLKEREK